MLISTTFVHVIKYLFLQMDCRYPQLIHSIVHSDGDPVVTNSAFCSITQIGVTAHPSFLIITLIHLPTIAILVLLTSKPLLWLGLLHIFHSAKIIQPALAVFDVFSWCRITPFLAKFIIISMVDVVISINNKPCSLFPYPIP